MIKFIREKKIISSIMLIYMIIAVVINYINMITIPILNYMSVNFINIYYIEIINIFAICFFCLYFPIFYSEITNEEWEELEKIKEEERQYRLKHNLIQ